MPEPHTWTCPRCGLHVTETPPDTANASVLLAGSCPRCGLFRKVAAPPAAKEHPQRAHVSPVSRESRPL